MLTSGCAFNGISVPAVIRVAIGALGAAHGLEVSQERHQLFNGWDFVARLHLPVIIAYDFVALPVSVSKEVWRHIS